MQFIKQGIWWFGIFGYGFGLSERSLSAMSDGVILSQDLILIFTAATFLVSWLLLKPTQAQANVTNIPEEFSS